MDSFKLFRVGGVYWLALTVVGVAAASCGKDASPGKDDGSGGEPLQQGGAGVVAEGGGGEQTSAGQPGAGGIPAALAGSGGVGGNGGEAPECDETAKRLVGLTRGDGEKYHFSYDEELRMATARGKPGSGVSRRYHYDTLGRLVHMTFDDSLEYGWDVSYLPSGAVRYTDPDMNGKTMIFVGRRWTEWYPDGLFPGPRRSASYDAFGQLASIKTEAHQAQPESVETFDYEDDEHFNPVRVVGELTTEVYDENRHHLLQTLDTAQGELSEVLLYANNADPIRSLTAKWNPPVTGNVWLRAPVDRTKDAYVGYTDYVVPDFFQEYSPLAFTRGDAVDFDYDRDGDDAPDISGKYSFDDADRFTGFVLSLSGEPRVQLAISYEPDSVTETISYPESSQASETRTFTYGCPTIGAGGSGH